MNARRYLRLLETVNNGHYTADLETGTIIGANRRPLKPQLMENGYVYVNLSKNGKTKMYTVHEVVAFFAGLDLIDKQVNHINGIKTDNRLENLETVTAVENMRHAKETGLWTAARGEQKSKNLTENDVRTIRARYARGNVTQTELAKEYGVMPQNIGRIVNNKAWTHVSERGAN